MLLLSLLAKSKLNNSSNILSTKFKGTNKTHGVSFKTSKLHDVIHLAVQKLLKSKLNYFSKFPLTTLFV